MLLPRLLAAVTAFHDRTKEQMWSIAARARMAPSQLSAIMKAARPAEEDAKVRSVEVASAERIADAVECELMVVPKGLVPEVERLLARDAKKRGSAS